MLSRFAIFSAFGKVPGTGGAEALADRNPGAGERPARPLTNEEWHKTYPLAKFVCRTAVEAMAIHDLDYVDLVLYMLVATTCMERLFGQGPWANGLPHLERGVPDDIEQPSLSRLSLAEDTRLPRETVRRRVAALIEKGWLAEDENGFLTVPPERFFNPANEALFRFMFDRHAELLATFTRIEAAAKE